MPPETVVNLQGAPLIICALVVLVAVVVFYWLTEDAATNRRNRP